MWVEKVLATYNTHKNGYQNLPFKLNYRCSQNKIFIWFFFNVQRSQFTSKKKAKHELMIMGDTRAIRKIEFILVSKDDLYSPREY